MSDYSILWADDEIDLLKPHIMFLRSKGYDPVTVNNGRDALDLVESRNFDLIILDENMPGLTGLETLQRIKEISPQIPKQYEHHFTVYGALLPGYTVEGQEQVKPDRTAADVSEGGISMPEKPEKPSVLGKLSAAKTQEKTPAAPGAANKKKEDMQL